MIRLRDLAIAASLLFVAAGCSARGGTADSPSAGGQQEGAPEVAERVVRNILTHKPYLADVRPDKRSDKQTFAFPYTMNGGTFDFTGCSIQSNRADSPGRYDPDSTTKVTVDLVGCGQFLPAGGSPNQLVFVISECVVDVTSQNGRFYVEDPVVCHTSAAPEPTSTPIPPRISAEDAARAHIDMAYAKDLGSLYAAMDTQYQQQGYIPLADFQRCHGGEPAPPHPDVRVVSSGDDRGFGSLTYNDATTAIMVELTVNGAKSTLVIHEVSDEFGTWHWIPTSRAIAQKDGAPVNAYGTGSCPLLVDVILSNELGSHRSTVQMSDLGRFKAMSLSGNVLYSCLYDTCPAGSPPQYKPATVGASSSVFAPWGLPGVLAVVPAEHGPFQLSYNGRPLFTYVGDGTGEARGQNYGWSLAQTDMAGIP